jgi:hypothetical protein
MTSKDITNQLQRIASADNFAARSAELTAAWSSSGLGLETVEAVLRFMEQYPTVDFGMPGPLVHFVERFRGNGYEEELSESVRRKPTLHTVWMLNRLINGTNDPGERRRLLATMEQARLNSLTGENVLRQLNRFLERLTDC